MPRELLALWNRATSGDKRVDIKKLLETVPRYCGIPSRPPENNLHQLGHRQKADRFLRTVQQSLLHLIRIHAAQLVKPQQDVGLQAFQYLAEQYHKILEERRELAVPGITKTTGQGGEEQLFSAEDVKLQKQDQGIQRISMGVSAESFKDSSFLVTGSNAGYRGYRAQNSSYPRRALWKGSGKGFKGLKGSWGKGATKGWKGQGQGVHYQQGQCGQGQRPGRQLSNGHGANDSKQPRTSVNIKFRVQSLAAPSSHRSHRSFFRCKFLPFFN